MRNSLYPFTALSLAALLGCSSPSGEAEGQDEPTGSDGATGSTATGGSGDSGATTSPTGSDTGTGTDTGTATTSPTGTDTGSGTTTTTSAGTTTTTGTQTTSGSGGAGSGSDAASSGGASSSDTTTTDAGSVGGATSASDDTTGGGGSMGTVTKFIGNIAPKNQDVPEDFADKWMQMSMEANSKWGFVQPNGPDDWVWGPVDEAYNYAKEHGIIFKQHNFFWHFEQPSWVNDGNVATYGPQWVQAFCERYPDIPMIDVVNEGYHNPAPYRGGMGGAGESGYDWIVTAFQWAKQYCPNSILIFNEYNIIEWEADNTYFINALEKILAAGAPIDALGAQGHDIYRAGTDVAEAYLNDLYERFGLPIYITELDIDLADDQEQLAKMEEEINMLWNHPRVYGITYWGFLQGSTWRTNAWLVGTNGSERPAMTWLQEFIAAHR